MKKPLKIKIPYSLIKDIIVELDRQGHSKQDIIEGFTRLVQEGMGYRGAPKA